MTLNIGMTMKPKLFIGSSAESLSVAYALQETLEHHADVTIWTQDVFRPSSTTIQSLLGELATTDFGLFVLGPDDIVNIRGDEFKAARDNVIFELGLFVGKLGLGKSFFMVPQDVDDFRLPADLLGVTPLRYKTSNDNIAAAVGPSCSKIQREIMRSVFTARPTGFAAEVTVIEKVNGGSRYAADRIRNSKVVRIVGTARHERLREVAEAADYLRAAEERAAADMPFVYYRITSPLLSAQFRKHLSNLLQTSKTRKEHRMEIAIEDQMATSVSYTLFDTDELLLVVDNNIVGNVRDNRLMMSCREPAIVKAFAEHFDYAWARLSTKCITKAQLERATSIKR